MNRIVMSGIVSALILSGCGGGSDDGSTSKKKGYYEDSAVEGVHYKCDNGEEGTTGKDGVFIFADATECTFSLAGIKLRTVSGTSLKDGTKVLEDDPQIAQLLQSLDIDGNPDKGGIVVNEEAFKKAIEELGIEELPTEDELKKILVEVAKNDSEYKGEFVTKEEAVSHVAHTAIGIVAGEATSSTKASGVDKLKELYAKAKIEELFEDAEKKLEDLSHIFEDKKCQSGSIIEKDKEDTDTLTADNCKNGDWTVDGTIHGEEKKLASNEEFNTISAESDISLSGPYGIDLKVSKGTFASSHDVSDNKEDTESEDMIAKGIFTINGIDISIEGLEIEKNRVKNITTLTLTVASLSIGDYTFALDSKQDNAIVVEEDKDEDISSVKGAFHLTDGAGQAVELTIAEGDNEDTVLRIKIDTNNDGKFDDTETLDIELNFEEDDSAPRDGGGKAPRGK